MSRSFELNKLVRDGIIEDMATRGQRPAVRTLDDQELHVALMRKLREEAIEVAAADALSRSKELIDLLEVIETLAEQDGVSFDEIRRMQLQRRQEMGGFAGRQFVYQITLAEDDEWVKYYAADPARFPEVES